MSSSDAATAPAAITGGCLCDSIRYTVNFTAEYPWPPMSSACHCTTCRKAVSSLVAQFLSIAPDQISPPLLSFSSHFPTYKEYASSPHGRRGFCSKCGTTLVWRSEEDTSHFDLFLGTIDERWLIGEKAEAGDRGDGARKDVKADRKGGLGASLAKVSGTHFWCENVVPGWPDFLKGGKKFARGDDGEEIVTPFVSG